MLNKKKAFTLIEILVIIAIVGLLASAILISMNSARVKAKDNSFKTTMKSIQTNLVSCCIGGDLALPNGDLAGEICAGGENYPGAESIGSIIGAGCGAGNFFKSFTPGTKNSGNCTSVDVRANSIDFFGC